MICGREADRAYFFLVIAHGTGVIAEVYPVDLSATEPYRLPRAETLKNVALAGRDAPEPLISILAQTDTCQLDTLSAVWEKEQLILSMSHGAEDCKVFKITFDPKKVEFTSIPKDWVRGQNQFGQKARLLSMKRMIPLGRNAGLSLLGSADSVAGEIAIHDNRGESAQ